MNRKMTPELESEVTQMLKPLWKIICLANLHCDIKYEFNSSNKKMYNDNLIIAKGSFSYDT